MLPVLKLILEKEMSLVGEIAETLSTIEKYQPVEKQLKFHQLVMPSL
jgi:hypothetical protein